jgi:hypothetical protein
MELKNSLISSNYKGLSKHAPWKKTYVKEKPWKEMAVDVDSLVFFYMRKYLEKPYSTRRDETMVCAAFVHDITASRELVINDMARYSLGQLVKILKFIKSIGIKTHPVCSTDIPRLKRELYQERSIRRDRIAQQIREMNVIDAKPQVLASIKEYMLHFRDEVRDIVVTKIHVHECQEADKWCGRNHRVTMSEDVDIFLFGHDRTTIVKPFLMDETPTHLDFLDCKSYYIHHDISDHNHFIQVCLVIGTDYNYGVKGMGVKRSVATIAKHGSIARYLAVKYDLSDENVAVFMDRHRQFMKYVMDANF